MLRTNVLNIKLDREAKSEMKNLSLKLIKHPLALAAGGLLEI